MKVFKLIPLMSMVFLLISCGEKRETDRTDIAVATPQDFQDPEEARRSWTNAWNSQDPQQIQSLAASDVVLVLNGREMPADSIPGFFKEAGSGMQDLEIKSLKKGGTDYLAYDTGVYQHRTTDDTTTQRGTYTFIWERTDNDNDWKVKSMNITDLRAIRE